MHAARLVCAAFVLGVTAFSTPLPAAKLRLICRDGDPQVVVKDIGPIDWATCDAAADGLCVFTIERAGCGCALKGCCGTDEFAVPGTRNRRVPSQLGRPRLVLRCLPARSCGVDPAGGTCRGHCPPGLACLTPPPGSFSPLACVCRRPEVPTTTTTTLPAGGCAFEGMQDVCAGECPGGLACLFDPGREGVPPGCACLPADMACEAKGEPCSGFCNRPTLRCAPPPPGSFIALACICQPAGDFCQRDEDCVRLGDPCARCVDGRCQSNPLCVSP